MAKPKRKRDRERGSITQRGDSFRVRVYAGTDPVTKKRINLDGTAQDAIEAEKLRTKFLAQVDEQRHPRSKATVRQILERWMTVCDVDDGTRERYEDLIRIYLNPTFGHLPGSKLNAEMLELFYARLRRCKQQCERKLDGVDGHRCVKLAPATIRKMHFILHPAFDSAVHWNYLGTNVVDLVDPPKVPRHKPDPPSAQEAARMLNKAWALDPDWATFLWKAMVTGCRRGELCSLQWCDVDFETQILTVAFSEQRLRKRKRRRKATKGDRERRISFDSDTADLLLALRERQTARCETLGIALATTAYVFSFSPDCMDPMEPDYATRRYRYQANKLGISSHRLHSLRHYSATELIAAGVDLRTVAGRLGHGSGGATTLKHYAAWMPSADERAATILSKRLPRPGRVEQTAPMIVNGRALACRCGNVTTWAVLVAERGRVYATCRDCGAQVVGTDPDAPNAVVENEVEEVPPYKLIAANLRKRIADGDLAPGHLLPTVKELAATYSVSVGTAHRAIALLTEEGLVTVRRGARAIVKIL